MGEFQELPAHELEQHAQGDGVERDLPPVAHRLQSVLHNEDGHGQGPTLDRGTRGAVVAHIRFLEELPGLPRRAQHQDSRFATVVALPLVPGSFKALSRLGEGLARQRPL